jgi:hypothetical protein
MTRPIDWKLYAALVGNDLPSWAGEIDPAIGKRLEDARNKAYQTERLHAGIERDPRLRATFEQQRKRVQSMVLYADANGDLNDACHRSMIYVANEFRLILGQSSERRDPLALATIAPGCPMTPQAGLQLTAGRSPRFRCWSGADDTRCGWRLPDMPESLKRIVESEYPGTIRLRWRWRGLGGTVHVRYLNANGNRLAERDAIEVTVPTELALQFVDDKGQLLWTASAATLGPSSH